MNKNQSSTQNKPLARILLIVFLGLLFVQQPCSAQSDDFGMWTSVELEKKVNKKFSLGLEAEMRTRDDAGEMDRWSFGLSGSYKLTKWLKAGAGYTLLYDNNEKCSYYDEGDDVEPGDPEYGKIKRRAQYWGLRHRVYAGLQGSVDVGRFKLSLRERWQYTYRPEKSVTREYYEYYSDERYGPPGELMDGYPMIEVDANGEPKLRTYKGKGKNVLRSRLQVDYDIPSCKVDPYASVELTNAWSVQKVRYTLGAEWKIRKVHTLNFYYRYQDIRNDDFDSEPDMHILGLGYKYKF